VSEAARRASGSVLTGTPFQEERTTPFTVPGGTFTTIRRARATPNGGVVFT
jgi:hypothetical protein